MSIFLAFSFLYNIFATAILQKGHLRKKLQFSPRISFTTASSIQSIFPQVKTSTIYVIRRCALPRADGVI